MQTRTSPRTQRTPKVAKLAQLADGTLLAASSRGPEQYRIALGDRPSCECLGFTTHGHCYHLSQAAEAFASFYTRPQLPAVRRARAADLYPDW